MIEFFSAMTGFEKTFWFIAIPSTFILISQLIMAISKMDSVNKDIDYEDDNSSFHFFTFRNLVTFFTVSSWLYIAFYNSGFSETSSLAYSSSLGILSMFIMAGMVYMLYKLKEEEISSLNSSDSKKIDNKFNEKNTSNDSRSKSPKIEDDELLLDESN